MPIQLSEDLVQQAREEAKAADRSITSQIEHWVRLGQSLETLLRHETCKAPIPPPTRQRILDALRDVAGESARGELAASITDGRVVYQDDGNGRIERIDRDGSRSVGRIVDRHFVADEPRRDSRR
jgi:hypothetical protein